MMRTENEFAQSLIDFIYQSPSPFHAVTNVKEQLNGNGFRELRLRDKWMVEKGGKYYVTRNDSAIIAFVIGQGDIAETGFHLVGAHTDAPTFRVKPAPEMVVENSYVRLNTEVYGGPILNTWLDRPLSIAGRVSLRGDDPFYPEIRLVNIQKPILVIPNLSIHMNRKVNEGIELNKQKDTLPLLTQITEQFEKNQFLVKLLAKELGVDYERVIDFDLYLYEYEKGSIIGLNEEFISCGKLDDLAMVHAGIAALIEAPVGQATNVMVCFDNEEVGSTTKQGADSPLLRNVLERITDALGKDREDFFRAIYSSFMISADMAHAVHPNSPEVHDPINRPLINKGPVIKINANMNYTTDCDSSAVFEEICRKAGVPVQKFVNRSDSRGGSTIGPISSSHLDIRTLDIGNPMFAMHSIREMGGVKDHLALAKALREYFSY